MGTAGPRPLTTRVDPAAMRGDPWFGALEPDLQRRLVDSASQQPVVRGGYVFHVGDAPSGFYGVIEGHLSVSSMLASGREVIFAQLEPGRWFGETSSIDGLPRTMSIRALGDLQLLHVDPRSFGRLYEDARFARAIATLQASRARMLFAFFEDASLRSARARLARRLLRLSGTVARARAGKTVISITHDTLALMLGVTRQTLSIELRALAAAGAVSLSYGHIAIESREALEGMSEP